MTKPVGPPVPAGIAGVRGDAAIVADSVVLTKFEMAVAWARKYSIFPYPFATACCAMEFMSTSMAPYDIDRFGAFPPRFSPRPAPHKTVSPRPGPRTHAHKHRQMTPRRPARHKTVSHRPGPRTHTNTGR